MGNQQNLPATFYRHFSFDTFKHFLSDKIIQRVRQNLAPKHRQRRLGLEGFLWLGLFVAAHAFYPNLQQIFNLATALPQSLITIPFVSVSAFCQYRAHFPLKIYLYLWRSLIDRFSTLSTCFSDTWRGLKLYALDTTLIHLPEALWPYFGSLDSRGPGPAQAFIMLLYNLAWSCPVAVRATKSLTSGSPQSLFKRFLHYLKKGDLLLLDTGFYSLEIFCLLLKQAVHFIIPIRCNGTPRLIKRFSKNDALYQIKASPYWRNNPLVPDSLIVRIITYQIPGFRPRRLVTSLLNPEAYPAEEIIQLYHRRWEIETFFRDYKHTLKATQWHARSLPAFWSELLFQMLLATLTRLAMAEAALKSGRLPQELSFSKSLAEVKRILLIIPLLPVSEWVRVSDELIQRLSTYLIDIRPGRRFERDTRKRRLQSRARSFHKIQSEEEYVA